MPIYEFYCDRCNTIFNFFSKSVNTEKIPDCPKCSKSLERRMSIFARITRGKTEQADEDMPPIDEQKMERAMAMLAGDAEKINDDDPKQAAALMRKLSDATGLNLGPQMEEALRRMEKGEDPEKIEEEMGDLLEGDDLFSFGGGKSGKGSKKGKPIVDDKLYDL
jgi:putative FmdB family regulatory protein